MKHIIKNSALRTVIRMPIFVAIGISISLIVEFVVHQPGIANYIMIAVILIGAYSFIYETLSGLFQGKFGLDYIALAAIITAFITQDYLVGAVIVLMLTTGDALEEYAMLRAKKSLTSLIDRIPKEVTLVTDDNENTKTTIEAVKVHERILIRRGEVIPLDGILESESGIADESSLTGEPYFMEKFTGDIVRSGTVNVGDAMIIRVTAADEQSTYRKIIQLVQEAANSQAPLVRLADKYSTVFTIITTIISVTAYLFTKDINIVLAVLVVATPCPLLLATPIALIGGMSASAKQKIIIKNLGSLEVLSRTQALIFDKTGTVTLGHATVKAVEVLDASLDAAQVTSIAAAIEHNSLHPLAKAIVNYAKEQKAKNLHAENVTEIIGKGISATVDGRQYTLGKHKGDDRLSIELTSNDQLVALLHLEDQIKLDSKVNLESLERSGFEMHMLTGDKQSVADEVVKSMGVNITVQGNCSPEDKLAKIHALQAEQKTVAMVGDGINDAPALAAANVGIVFANEEHTAASEAADIVLLGGDFSLVLNVLHIAKRTIRIALQSIWVGIGLSIGCMIAAAFGLIPALIGSIIQEGIDVLVIINALRASR